MLKNKLIISPLLLPWDWSADYQKQTLTRLAQHNQIILWDQKNAYFFLKRPRKNSQLSLPKNISLVAPRYFLPFRRIPFVEALNRKLSFFFLLWQFRKQSKIIWVFDPFFQFIRAWNNSILLYDCVDFHSGQPHLGQEIAQQENALIQNADLFFVNSKTLAKIHSGKKRDIHLVPQGFDVESFQNAKKQKAPWKFRKPKQPVIGFVGGLSDRLDFSLLESLVKNNPQWNFALWGPIQTPTAKKRIAQLKRIGNFAHGQTQHRNEVASLIEHFDVAIIPYDSSQSFNRFCHPMKIFEYFYVGKPVVSTSIEELHQFPEFVIISNSAQTWEKAIQAFLAQPWLKQKRATQQKVALANSWAEKLKAITQKIETFEQS